MTIPQSIPVAKRPAGKGPRTRKQAVARRAKAESRREGKRK